MAKVPEFKICMSIDRGSQHISLLAVADSTVIAKTPLGRRGGRRGGGSCSTHLWLHQEDSIVTTTIMLPKAVHACAIAGFTVFLERKIIGRLHGEQALQFHAANGYLSLVDSIHQIGETHNFTALVPDLSGGVDPDDSFSKVPYEKGFYFLYYLQVKNPFPSLSPPHPHPPPA